MFAGKPIIGIVGGIGSGKTYVAGLFGELGCLVIDSDQQVREAYQREDVKRQLREWWGPEVFRSDGQVDRGAIARRVFSDPAELSRLESLLHPLVAEARNRAMAEHADSAQVLAFVWDTPLLVESGLYRECDAVVFVDAPLEDRLNRVGQGRGWSAEDLGTREKLQAPLDTKRNFSDYIVRNTAGANEVRAQVRDVLSRILRESTPTD